MMQQLMTILPVMLYDLSDENLTKLYEKVDEWNAVKRAGATAILKEAFRIEDCVNASS